MFLLLLDPLHHNICTNLPFDHAGNRISSGRRADYGTPYHPDIVGLNHLSVSRWTYARGALGSGGL
jgi:hypothetical protein